MSIAKLLNKIYLSPVLCKEIIFFYDNSRIKIENITKERFNKVCTKYQIDLFPSILLPIFDAVGIKIAIFPYFDKESPNAEIWSSRIYSKGKILVNNNYSKRAEATLQALEDAITLYLIQQDEKQKSNP